MTALTTIIIIAETQSGAVTHHHDQSMYPVNFKTRNIINKAPKNPMPVEDDLFFLI